MTSHDFQDHGIFAVHVKFSHSVCQEANISWLCVWMFVSMFATPCVREQIERAKRVVWNHFRERERGGGGGGGRERERERERETERDRERERDRSCQRGCSERSPGLLLSLD